LSLSILTGCENESIDSDFTGLDNPSNPTDPSDPTDPGSNESDLTMSSYQYNIDTATPLFGNIIVNTDFIMNTNNTVENLDINSILFGATIVGNGTITRDTSGKITAFKSFEGNTQANQTDITYNGNTISSISYDDFEDDNEDYTYSFTTSGNIIVRTSSVSNVSVEYTFNTQNQLVKKESTENGVTLQTEILTYDAIGNCTTVDTTGENPNNTTYGFDAFTNPLKTTFSDQFYYSILEADYDAEAGPNIVQFYSTNNWNSITTAQGQVTFSMTYNTANRISSRTGAYDLGDGVVINQQETYNYVN